MPMTWLQFKTFVKAKVQFDSESDTDLTTITSGSLFDARCGIFLQGYVRFVKQFYDPLMVLTTAASITQNLSTAAAKPVYDPKIIWIGNSVLLRQSESQIQAAANLSSASSGTPIMWASTGEYTIMFDKPATAAIANSYVAGWHDHPALVDATNLSIPDFQLEYVRAYCAANFIEGVDSDATGMSRLASLESKAYDAIMKIKAENSRRLLQDWSENP